MPAGSGSQAAAPVESRVVARLAIRGVCLVALVLAAGVAAGFRGSTLADTTVNFEQYPAGTVLTDQYANAGGTGQGVVFGPLPGGAGERAAPRGPDTCGSGALGRERRRHRDVRRVRVLHADHDRHVRGAALGRVGVRRLSRCPRHVHRWQPERTGVRRRQTAGLRRGRQRADGSVGTCHPGCRCPHTAVRLDADRDDRRLRDHGAPWDRRLEADRDRRPHVRHSAAARAARLHVEPGAHEPRARAGRERHGRHHHRSPERLHWQRHAARGRVDPGSQGNVRSESSFGDAEHPDSYGRSAGDAYEQDAYGHRDVRSRQRSGRRRGPLR